MSRLLIILHLFVSVLFMGSCYANEHNVPMISILYDDMLLQEAKEAFHKKDGNIMPVYMVIKNYVDSISMNLEPLSVAQSNKIHIAPSGDPRDYITLSPYWWPDSQKVDGIPYIRKDGKRNPEVYEYLERVNSTIFSENVQLLAVTYFLSEEEKYAEKAAEMLRVWFLDPITGMNPNMTYSQYVPGMNRIRGTGIIDARKIIGALNAAKIVENSFSWTEEDKRQLQEWTRAFRYWLEHSTNGLAEAKAQNNHGLWYDVIHQALAMYEEDFDYVKSLIIEQTLPRIDRQIHTDGSFPKELERTLGLHYSTFALEALSLSDIMGSKVGLNLWEYRSENGGSMVLALEFLKPYFIAPETWPYMQINEFERDRCSLLLYIASRRTGNKEFENLAKLIGYYPEFSEKENSNSLPRINSLLYYKINL